MARDKSPVTPAIRFLKQHNVDHSQHLYRYEEKGGTTVSARELGVEEHQIIKTLVMEDEQRKPLIVLMHGDQEVSTKELARSVVVKTISPCNPETALKHTGYQVGGTSPFGMRTTLPIYAERSILDMERVTINGGKRGFLVTIDVTDLVGLLDPEPVDIAI